MILTRVCEIDRQDAALGSLPVGVEEKLVANSIRDEAGGDIFYERQYRAFLDEVLIVDLGLFSTRPVEYMNDQITAVVGDACRKDFFRPVSFAEDFLILAGRCVQGMVEDTRTLGELA